MIVKIAVAFLSACVCSPLGAADSKPNLVVFMADDLGYGDVGCFGSPRAKTPNIDGLAQQGVKFTQFYAPASTCSPTRSGLLTGRSPLRLGIFTYIPNKSGMHLIASEKTLPALLREAGYDTCFVGKWGVNGLMGSDKQPQPNDHGFNHYLASQNNAIPSHLDPTCFFRNGKPTKVDGYSAAVIVDEAITWLKNREDDRKPFCLFVWFHEPHRPIATPPQFSAKFEQVPADPNRLRSKTDNQAGHPAPSEAEYVANIAHMDWQVGRLVGDLDKNGHGQRTCVVFTSDNGPISPGSAGPLRGSKGTLWEGGIRIPGIIRWPDHVRKGTVIDTPVSALDLLPTFCHLSGVPVPSGVALDGENIVPLLNDKPFKRTKPLFWWKVGGEAALRVDNWKLIGTAEKESNFATRMDFIKTAKLESFSLYDLASDPAEKSDVIAKHPKLSLQLKANLVATHAAYQKEAPKWSDRDLPKGDD